MTFEEKVNNYLSNDHITQAIQEFRSAVSECPVANKDAVSDGKQLTTQLNVISANFKNLTDRINSNTVSDATAKQERNSVNNSLSNIINQLEETYPSLYEFIQDRDEEEEWTNARQVNNINTYEKYFKKYAPNGKYLDDAKKFLDTLKEKNQKWEEEKRNMAEEERERREQAAKKPEESKPAATEYKPEKQYANTSSSPAQRTGGNKMLKYAVIGIVALILIIVIIKFSGTKETATTTEINTANITKVYFESVDNILGTFTFNPTYNVWREENTKYGPGEFSEVNRNATSIYLKKDNGVNIQLDLYANKVYIDGQEVYDITKTDTVMPDIAATSVETETNPAAAVAEPTSNEEIAAQNQNAVAPVEITGRNVTKVTYPYANGSNGSFTHDAERNIWLEQNSDNNNTEFNEVARDDWSVYLTRKADGTKIQLDLHQKKIYINEHQELYEITSWE